MYLAVDGGGSKIAAILYDDNFDSVAFGRSGGVNKVQNSPESVREHIDTCLDAVLSGIRHVDAVDAVFAGDCEYFTQAIRRHLGDDVTVRFLGEAYAGLLAGACRRTGALLLSGTGSDSFYLKDGKMLACVGGWGPFMGDQGSGAWIGLQALRAAGRDRNGWGEPTALSADLETWCRKKFGKGMLETFVYHPSPYSAAAQAVPVVADAARRGDRVALSIFRAAGEAMAKQLLGMLSRKPEITDRDVFLCGGAWKAHESMKNSCEEFLRRTDPAFTLHRPLFEHVMAGLIERMLDGGKDEADIRRTLAMKYPEYVINREEAVL